MRRTEDECNRRKKSMGRGRRLACGLAAAICLTGCGSFHSNEGSSGIIRLVAAGDIQEGNRIQDAAGTGNPETGTVSGTAGGYNSEEVTGTAGESRSETASGAGGESRSEAASGAAGKVKPEETLEPEITLVMVGDILLHTPVAESGKKGEEYDFSAVFAQMKEEIEAADLALVNQEVILGGRELGVSGYPTFNAPYELGDALVEAGFDVVLHATNHALDKGKKGVLNCLSFWKENYPEIAVLGIHDSQEDQQEIYVYEQEGIRTAILNYTYGTNGIPLPADMPYGVDLLERERVAADLRRAQELADFVVVCPHWGTEYVLEPAKEQEEWAAFLAENGADLVLGTHPHVLEPVVWVGRDAQDNEGLGNMEDGIGNISGSLGNIGNSAGDSVTGGALVYYSLGNFVNWTASTGAGIASRMVGGMAKVTIGRNEEGEAVVKAYELEPLVCHVESGFGGVTVYPLSEYTEELAGRNEIVKQDSSFSLEYCRKLVEEVLGSD